MKTIKKKAQGALLWLVFSILFTIIVWAMFAAPLISVWGHEAVIAGSYTGFEKLFYENINLAIGFGIIITSLWLGLRGGTN